MNKKYHAPKAQREGALKIAVPLRRQGLTYGQIAKQLFKQGIQRDNGTPMRPQTICGWLHRFDKAVRVHGVHVFNKTEAPKTNVRTDESSALCSLVIESGLDPRRKLELLKVLLS